MLLYGAHRDDSEMSKDKKAALLVRYERALAVERLDDA